MRVVAGKYGGRILETPKDRVIRPTSDKVRGAVFNALQSRGAVEGAHVLDAFCGTGALGFEALSQGAHSCLFFDKSRESLALAKRNGAALGVGDEAKFTLQDATKIKTCPEDTPPYSLIFLDPPYDQNLILPTLSNLHNAKWVSRNAIIMVEAEKGFDFSAALDALDGVYVILSEKTYGDTNVILLEYSA